jgi:hypothetical protein
MTTLILKLKFLKLAQRIYLHFHHSFFYNQVVCGLSSNLVCYNQVVCGLSSNLVCAHVKEEKQLAHVLYAPISKQHCYVQATRAVAGQKHHSLVFFKSS